MSSESAIPLSRRAAVLFLDLMERHDLPYVTGSLPKQAASVYWKVIELSLPNKVEGRRRRDIVRLSLKKAWKKKSLGRF